MTDQGTNETRKIYSWPLLVTLFFSVILGGAIFILSSSTLKRNQIEDGIELAQVLSKKIELKLQAYEIITENINATMIQAGETVILNRDILSSAYLNEVMEIFNLDELYWYSPQGVVLFDALDQYVGWEAQEGDPIYQFMNSGENLYIEEFRLSTENDNLIKNVYIKTLDNYFVQAVLNATYVSEMTRDYELQIILEETLNNSEDLLFVRIIDVNMNPIAELGIIDNVVNYSSNQDYTGVFDGNSAVNQWYYPQMLESILEISVPLESNSEVIGLISLGYSQAEFIRLKGMLVLLLLILILSTIFIYLYFQNIYIFRPIKKLKRTITELDPDHDRLIGNTTENDLFMDVYEAINDLIDKVRVTTSKNTDLSKEVESLAYYDFLTKLPNRYSFLQRMQVYVKESKKCAVYFMDLDGFKELNDTKGHMFGDQVLVFIAEKLNKLSEDRIYVSRYGGDEFLILYQYDEDEEIMKLGDMILHSFDEPFLCDQGLCYVNVSIGFSLYPKDDFEVEQVIRKADIAMYFAKQKGKNQIVSFNHSMESNLTSDYFILSAIRTAIKLDGFKMVYQPHVNIYTNEITGIEALVRLSEMAISPGIFIPLAEKSGLIHEIGHIVINLVVEQISLWKKEFGFDMTVFINVSSKQFEDDSLIDYFQNALHKYNVSPTCLGVEITETAMIENPRKLMNIMEGFSRIGIKIAIDDFGSGHSGINYLTKYNVNMVKIDKGFVDQFLNLDGITVFNMVINLIDELGFTSLAEGIEEERQVEMLKETKCQFVQGYYYYKPMDAFKIKDLLTK